MLLAGCSQNQLLTRQDYDISQQDFLRGDAGRALEAYPHRAEQGTFITAMEQAYLSLIQGQPQIGELQKQAALQQNQVRYRVSREARTFFYVQTPEDYYPSEHEVVWMHFLLSWGYAQQGKFQDACVEARAASDLLALPWSPNGHFDDPAMRLMLASLWAMCGEWREAQVDLRAAWTMDQSLAWAHELAERNSAPAHLFIVLGGPGPEVEWDPQHGLNPLRAGRQVRFHLRGAKDPLSITDRGGTSISPYLSPDAAKWYERHLARESELHDVIEDSAYGAKAAGNGTVAAGKIAWTTALGVGFATGGVMLGVEFIRFATTWQDIATGLGVAGYSVGEGMEISDRGYEASTGELKRELDPSPGYRFVRYLPEYLWMGWSDQPVAYPVQLRTATANLTIAEPAARNRNSVTLAYMPEAGGAKSPERVRCDYGTAGAVILPPNEHECPHDPPAAKW